MYLKPAGSDPPTRDANAVTLKNATQGQAVFQQGSLTGRTPTICRRQPAAPVLYLPCGTPGWIAATAGNQSNWQALFTSRTPLPPLALTVGDFTLACEVYCTAPDISSLLVFGITSPSTIDGFVATVATDPLDYDQVSVTGAGFSDGAQTPGTSPPGRSRWAMVRTGHQIQLYRDGTLTIDHTLNSSVAASVLPSDSFLYAQLFAPPTATLQVARLYLRTIADASASVFSPGDPPRLDGTTPIYFPFTEGSGPSSTDTQSSLLLAETDTDPSVYTWATTPQP